MTDSVPVKIKSPPKTVPEIFATSTMSPEERQIIRGTNTQFTLLAITSLPFVVWMSRTLTLPRSQYHHTFLRGTIMRFRPWSGLTRISGAIFNFFLILSVFFSIEIYTSHQQFQQLVSLNTDMARELRYYFYKVNPKYYEKIVPENMKKQDSIDRGDRMETV